MKLMKHLCDAAVLEEMTSRLSRLGPESERHWGKMSVAQMLAHCSEWMDMALGRTAPPRSWLGYVFGGVAKRSILSDKPLPPNLPTDKSFVMDDQRDFASERERLRVTMSLFSAEGPCKQAQHPFFGRMKPEEWARMAYKHLDHHFRQFGA